MEETYGNPFVGEIRKFGGNFAPNGWALCQGQLLLIAEKPITEARRYGFAEYRGVRTARYTYVRSIRGPWLLYDNERDPFQMHNLCGRGEHKDLQSRLDRALDETLRRHNDGFLPAAEYVKRAGVGHYREVNVAVGRHASPWGDWDSTLIPR